MANYTSLLQVLSPPVAFMPPGWLDRGVTPNGGLPLPQKTASRSGARRSAPHQPRAAPHYASKSRSRQPPAPREVLGPVSGLTELPPRAAVGEHHPNARPSRGTSTARITCIPPAASTQCGCGGMVISTTPPSPVARMRRRPVLTFSLHARPRCACFLGWSALGFRAASGSADGTERLAAAGIASSCTARSSSRRSCRVLDARGRSSRQ